MIAQVMAWIRQSQQNTAIAGLGVLVIVIGVVVGIASVSASPATTPTASPTVQPTGDDEPNPVQYFVPGGTAEQNKPFFDYTNRQTIALTKGSTNGQSFIDGLVAGGFDRGSMQLTPDTTAANLKADSIQFSVLIGDQCLIGQWGDGSQGYKSQIAPVISGIGCLIGKTRPIDW